MFRKLNCWFVCRQNPMTDSLSHQCLSVRGKPKEIPDLNASSEVWMINSSHPCVINNTTTTQSGRLSLSLWMKVSSRNWLVIITIIITAIIATVTTPPPFYVAFVFKFNDGWHKYILCCDPFIHNNAI